MPTARTVILDSDMFNALFIEDLAVTDPLNPHKRPRAVAIAAGLTRGDAMGVVIDAG